MTVAQRWRYRRNLVIALAHKHGCSQRFLADVFDLPRSRIGEIVREVRALAESRGSDQPRNPDRPAANRVRRVRAGGKPASAAGDG